MKSGSEARCSDIQKRRGSGNNMQNEADRIRINKEDLRGAVRPNQAGSRNGRRVRSPKHRGGSLPGIPPRGTMRANRRIAGKKCPICQDEIHFREQVQICAHCRLPFHTSCWDENGGCGTYGCEGSPGATQALEEPRSSANLRSAREADSEVGPPPLGNRLSDIAAGARDDTVRRTSGFAVASFVLGLVSLLLFMVFGILPLLAIVFGHCALSEMKKSQGELGGRGLAIAGLVLGYVTGAVALLWFVSISAG